MCVHSLLKAVQWFIRISIASILPFLTLDVTVLLKAFVALCEQIALCELVALYLVSASGEIFAWCCS